MILQNTTPLEVLEQKVIEFLSSFAKDEHALHVITPHLAKISLEMNHLYEDLGFANRTQMAKYMKEHFPSLCEIKPADKLWKKFIYDSIGEIAPACENCSDQDNCWACRV
jgi:nitrogen fixation protein NifQ